MMLRAGFDKTHHLLTLRARMHSVGLSPAWRQYSRRRPLAVIERGRAVEQLVREHNPCAVTTWFHLYFPVPRRFRLMGGLSSLWEQFLTQ